MKILAELRQRFRLALADLVDDPSDVLQMVRPAQDPRFGDYQANCAMPLGKRLARPPRQVAAEIVALEQRALRAEELLSSMMKAGELLSQALGEAGETFGFMHACMFGAEHHLRENGWIKPDVRNCQAPPTHMSNDCPIHGLDDERPF